MKITVRFSRTDLPRLGQHIRDLRTATGLTQSALADRAGLAEGTVRAVETGRSNPALPTVLALAAALGTTLDRMIAALARGQVAVTRAGRPAVDLADGVLRARVRTFDPASRAAPPGGAAMVHVIAGSLRLTLGRGEPVDLMAGDGAHARAGAVEALEAIEAVAGAATVLIVTDRRTEGDAR